MRHLWRAVALTVAALALLPAAGQAATISDDDALRELDTARDLVERSVTEHRAGNSEQAYETARNAYLDHFEYVEIPLRVRDEGLTLELEEDFAGLRNGIEDGAPVADVERIAGELRGGLDEVERELREPGFGAPLIAFVFSFILLFREGLEAVLIVAAILGYLEASRNRRYRSSVLKGVGAAGVATVATFVLITAVVSLAPVQRELLEAITTILAVIVLFYVSFWLIARLEHRRWMEFVSSRVWAASTTGATLALAGVGFTAVYREGFETVLLYQALFSMTTGLTGWVVLGAAAAAAVLAVIAWLVFRAGKRLPVKVFLGGAVLLVMAMSVAFIGNAVRELQQAAYLPVTFLEDFPRLPIFLADLTGYHPTRESILAQVALTLVYVAGAVWLFVVTPARERRALRRVTVERELAPKPVEQSANGNHAAAAPERSEEAVSPTEASPVEPRPVPPPGGRTAGRL